MDSFLGRVNVNELVSLTQGFATIGSIAPLKNLVGDSVFLFTGQNDRTVLPRIAKKNKTFYQKLGVEKIKILDGSAAGRMKII